MWKKSKLNFKSVFELLILVELFLMMWATDNIMIVKIVLIFLIIGVGFVSKGKKAFVLLRENFIWIFIYVLVNVFYMILSFIYANEGALVEFNVGVVEPILYMLLISLIDARDFTFLKKFIIYVSLFLYCYLILGFLQINNLIPIGQLPFIKANFGGVLVGGLMKPVSSFVAWFTFLIPANTVLFFFKEEVKDKMLKKIVVCNFILGLICVVLVLRTILILLAVISIVLSIYLVRQYRGKKNKVSRNSIIIGIGMAVILVLVGSWSDFGKFTQEVIVKKIINSFNVSSDYINEYGVIDSGAATRIEQIEDLIDTWLEKPILGWGTGAEAKNISRSNVLGTYEITYLAMLMQRGIVGLVIYFCMIGWIYIKSFGVIKQNAEYKLEMLYVIVGLSGFLIANATNPYLQSFDKLIALFLPFLILNLAKQTD